MEKHVVCGVEVYQKYSDLPKNGQINRVYKVVNDPYFIKYKEKKFYPKNGYYQFSMGKYIKEELLS